ncbi:MAG TPA: molybdopterin-binding protein, partial [Nitrospiria bacterium]
VAIKPGGPLAFWLWGRKPVFGLPGNPVSAMVTFEEFVRPAIRKMAGHRILGRPLTRAVLSENFSKRPGKTVFARAVISREGEGLVARPLGNQSSGALAAMSRANGLIILPSEKGDLKAGTVVQVRLLGDHAWWVKSGLLEKDNYWIRDME